MKQSNNLPRHPATNAKKTKAENKDTLDSRKNEEFEFKGDDVTHNRKATKKGKKKNG
ncbi:hypothetical protein [Compostibacter hankyongensis]|uniref:Uncharacterized protein n=1 Tax=Compostibacter hankyongensis TaxID=1007089 RepID=A0ABP8G0X8_9BACT